MTFRVHTPAGPGNALISPTLDMSAAMVYAPAMLGSTITDMTDAVVVGGPASAGCCAPEVGIDAGLDPERIAVLAAALAAPLRVAVVDVLRRSGREVCQCELIAHFGVGQSLLSHHLKTLVDAGVVRVERRHRWAWYSVPATAFEELTRWLA
jgi:ArsR family transcriptional regulator